ncbi:hypothetical protein [Eikenella corrodens]|uniref:hypothetical protein n=1 Tax=Eikenella corrodens TaxID=539 RepID=UPI0012AC7262|nr:hypothetical protein [Eikenella corrodens]
MQTKNNLVVMLTHNDQTVLEAAKIFEQCRHSKAQFWGFKEVPLPLENMKHLYAYMKECGKTTFLEVVEYTEDAGLVGAEIAFECGCDILMGTRFFDSINQFCKKYQIKYMPFVGGLQGRPTVLTGQIEDIITEAQEYAAKGVYGINLLGYRYVGDANRLNAELVRNVSIPVCLAGSINSYQRLDEVKAVSPWAFTIGSAFFENRFSGSIPEQINKVYEYMNDS